MNAKIGSRYGNDRVELQNVIPLNTPFLLFVDPSSACNFKCKFCPCGGGNRDVWDKNKRVGIMSYEVYRKVIDDVGEFPNRLKTLRLYKEGEPLLNKRLPDMIHYARRKDVADRIDFTTNASLLDEDLALAIVDAGVDRINISIEAIDKAGYAKISGVPVEIERLVRNIDFLYKNKNGCHIFLKISDLGLGEHSETEFYEMFGDMCDEIAVEHITSVWPEFTVENDLMAKGETNIYGIERMDGKQEICPYIFYSLCVNSDGTVSACLMDWNHQLIVGDTKKQSLLEIWNGAKMHELRERHLMLQKKEYHTCANCGQLQYAVLDNIDPYRENLLEKIRGGK